MFDAQRNIDRETLAAGPSEIRAIMNGAVGETIVGWEHGCFSASWARGSITLPRFCSRDP
jgi:hypothetical protein